MRRGLLATAVLTAAATSAPGAAPEGTAFLAVSWTDNSVHYLDIGLRPIDSFTPAVAHPKAIATNGWSVWLGAFGPNTVMTHAVDGRALYEWADPSGAARLRAMTYVRGELAVLDGRAIHFHDAGSGERQRSIRGPAETVEAIAYDAGSNTLFALADEIVALDPADGATRYTIPNPARTTPFGGTALAAIDRHRLLVGGVDGSWFIIDARDGRRIRWGNNGLDMYGLVVVADLCPCDVACDGMVDFEDVLALFTAWGDRGGRADLDRNGRVDAGDLVHVVNDWGPCPLE